MANLYFNGSEQTPFHLDPSIADYIYAGDEPIPININSSGDGRIDIKTVKFGYGYGQRTTDLNPNEDTIRVIMQKKRKELVHAVVRFMQGNTMRDFAQYSYYDRSPGEFFYWRKPYESEVRKWICGEWNYVYEDAGFISLELVFEEVFDPGVI